MYGARGGQAAEARDDGVVTGAGTPMGPDFSGTGAALASWPGAVVELDGRGAVLGANEAGRRLVESLDDNAAGVLFGLAAIALHGGGSVRDRIEVVHGDKRRWYECVALPCDGHRVLVLGRDDTYDISVRQALFDSRQRYRDLVTISSDFAWETGPDGTFVFVSPQGALGYSADELLGRRPLDLLADGDVDEDDLPFHTRTPVSDAQVWLRDVNGAEACVLASAVPIRDSANAWSGVRGLCRDVTQQRLRDSQLAQSKIREQVVAYVVNQIREEARPQAMLEAAAAVLGRATSASVAVFSLDEEGASVLSAVYGEWPADRVSGPVIDFIRDGRTFLECPAGGWNLLGRTTRYHGATNGAVVLARPDGGRVWSDEDNAMLDAVAGQLAIGLRQIADHTELERLSTTDSLTGLMNRRAFQAALGKCLAQARRNGRHGVLLFVDLDNFKLVNDTRGHEVGDTVLREVAAVLHEGAREYDLVARIGGDEFVVWMNETRAADIRQRVDHLVGALARLGRFSDDPERPLSGSIGLAEYDPRSGESVEELLSRADSAMYMAKKAGKARFADAPAAAGMHRNATTAGGVADGKDDDGQSAR